MKKQMLKVVNSLLKPFDVELVRRTANGENANLHMDAMIQRLAQRSVPVQSVIDIGASDGKWSISCMKYFPNALYLAVEPLEERQEVLETNKCRFTNFDYALCVAGKVDGGEVNFNVTADLDGSTVEGQNPGVSRTCRVRTLDSLATERNLSGPYLLKFDTHGYEKPILSGSSCVLANTTAIIMETYNFQLTPTSLRFHEMCTHLERLGFRPADIAEPMLRLHDKAFWQIDILFLKLDADMFKYQHYR
jgi:FkbM family methyltransferase